MGKMTIDILLEVRRYTTTCAMSGKYFHVFQHYAAQIEIRTEIRQFRNTKYIFSQKRYSTGQTDYTLKRYLRVSLKLTGLFIYCTKVA
jgi:hypothetical protein